MAPAQRRLQEHRCRRLLQVVDQCCLHSSAAASFPCDDSSQQVSIKGRRAQQAGGYTAPLRWSALDIQRAQADFKLFSVMI